MPNKAILVCGSLAYDTILTFDDRFANHILPDKIHILNVSFLAKNKNQNFGGTAGNIAFSSALLGLKPTIFSTVGLDFNIYRLWLQENGVNLDGVREYEDQYTAAATIITDLDDNQITAFHAGAMVLNDIPHRGLVDPSKFHIAIISPDGAEGMQRRARECKQEGLGCIIDPGQSLPLHSGDQLREMIQGARALILNDYELQLTCEKTGLSEEKLLELTPTVVTTLGPKGSRICDREAGVINVSVAPSESVVDPTGAGDAYRAGFLAGLVHGAPLEACAKLGAVAGTYAVERQGTQNHRYDLEEFKARYEKTFGTWPLG